MTACKYFYYPHHIGAFNKKCSFQKGTCVLYSFMSKNIHFRIISISLTGLVVFSGIILDAEAASDDECQEYARVAVAQQRVNKNLGCNLNGLRWGSDRTGHFIFCKAVGSGLPEIEIATRADKLAQCRNANAGNPIEENEPIMPQCKSELDLSRFRLDTDNVDVEGPMMIDAWQNEAREMYGQEYAKYSHAKNGSIECSQRRFGIRFMCTIKAEPCNG